VGTHVTGPEKPWQTGDDVVMAFLVEQDQLFGLGGAKRGDVGGTVCIHQQDLVVKEGRSGTEFLVAARTEWNAGFVMEQQSEFFLEFATFSKALPFRVFVHPKSSSLSPKTSWQVKDGSSSSFTSGSEFSRPSKTNISSTERPLRPASGSSFS